jgi:uncharacterized protein (TIGR02145 family)
MIKHIKHIIIPGILLTLTACTNFDLSPSIKNSSVTLISNSEAYLSAVVNANDQITTVLIEYGTTVSYDKIIHPTPDKIGGNTYVTVAVLLKNLNPDTRYHYRIKANNLCGTTIGVDRTFVTSPLKEINFNPDIDYGSMTDYDGNSYKTIKIGSQTWMVENLKTTHLNNGKPIQQVTDNDAWSKLTTPGYSWYNNDPDILNVKYLYGALYNYYTIETGCLCPRGWHVPADEEWYRMITFLGEYENAGGKLKEAGFDHWSKPNAGATNESGFTALPGGKRLGGGTFGLIGYYGFWWTSLDTRTQLVWGESLSYDYPSVSSAVDPSNNGYSVRCVKDQ